MLLELRAENYAVIDQAVASFGPGLNLLTGETGAGKSILIDALALLLGGKASSDVVRMARRRRCSAAYSKSTPRSGGDPGGEWDRCGRVFSDDILLRREIAAGGKGRVFVNNQPATVAVLRELAPELGLIHTQGETLGSFDQAQQRGVAGQLWWALPRTTQKQAYTAWRTTTAQS
jgi:DNA repair protein RecN (Recombination protein N)